MAMAEMQAQAEAERERERLENEARVAKAKQAYLEYLSSRNDKESYRLRRMLHGLPADPFDYNEREARKSVERLLSTTTGWGNGSDSR